MLWKGGRGVNKNPTEATANAKVRGQPAGACNPCINAQIVMAVSKNSSLQGLKPPPLFCRLHTPIQ